MDAGTCRLTSIVTDEEIGCMLGDVETLVYLVLGIHLFLEHLLLFLVCVYPCNSLLFVLLLEVLVNSDASVHNVWGRVCRLRKDVWSNHIPSLDWLLILVKQTSVIHRVNHMLLVLSISHSFRWRLFVGRVVLEYLLGVCIVRSTR